MKFTQTAGELLSSDQEEEEGKRHCNMAGEALERGGMHFDDLNRIRVLDEDTASQVLIHNVGDYVGRGHSIPGTDSQLWTRTQHPRY